MTSNDDELIQQGKDGDLGSFNLLVERYQTQVYNLTLRMLGNHQDAEDATQETFTLAWKGLRRFRGGSFRAWLLRIASNSCTDALRSSRHRKNTESIEELYPESNPLASSLESPEEHTLRQELSDLISDCLLQLPKDQRLVIALADIQGLRYDEIAEVANTSIGTVKSRLNRGRANLRDQLLKRREHLPAEFRLDY